MVYYITAYILEKTARETSEYMQRATSRRDGQLLAIHSKYFKRLLLQITAIYNTNHCYVKTLGGLLANILCPLALF